MPQGILYINAGNTHIGIFDPEKEAAGEKLYSHEEFFSRLDSWSSGKKLLVSSVVPEVTGRLREKGAFLVSSQMKMPFRIPEGLCISTVGADRLCNAAGLLSGKLPAISIDFGTAVTLELIAENGEFYSGGILPGRQLMRLALHNHTALLPLIPLDQKIPEGAAFTTEESLALGTDLAAVGAVRELLRRLQKAFSGPEGNVRLVACGGDRKFFLPYFPEMEEDSLLTYKGLRKIGEENRL